jgi:HSP20 family protein
MRYDPWEELRRIQEEMDSLFGNILRPARRRLEGGEAPTSSRNVVPYAEPAADVVDKGDEFKVMVDLPGMNKEDISVTVRDNIVNIKAEKKTEREEEREGYYFQERGYQGFSRSIPLPDDVVPDKTQGQYNNGVLELTLKKKHPSSEKEYKVEFD